MIQPNDDVYAVKADGKDFMVVALTLEGLLQREGDEDSFGQCVECGGVNQAGDLVGFTILASRRMVRCDGCGRLSGILVRPAREVCF